MPVPVPDRSDMQQFDHEQLALIAPDRFAAGRDLLLRIVSMLIKLGRSVARNPGTGTGTDGDPDVPGRTS